MTLLALLLPCAAWVQGPLDLDPSAYAQDVLSLNGATATLSATAGTGACPDGCEVTVSLTVTGPENVIALYSYKGLGWTLYVAPVRAVATPACGEYASADVYLYDTATSQHAETFVRIGCEECRDE